MTNMRPYSDVSSLLRNLYHALDRRQELVAAGHRASKDYDHWNRTIAELAGTLADGDPRLLHEENEFLQHLLFIEGFTFPDRWTMVVPDVEPERDHSQDTSPSEAPCPF